MMAVLKVNNYLINKDSIAYLRIEEDNHRIVVVFSSYCAEVHLHCRTKSELQKMANEIMVGSKYCI